MNFAQLDTEFAARGFKHLGSRRAQYLNDAYLLDICELEHWPWLEKTAKGKAPLEISDLGHIWYVIDRTTNVQLQPLLEARIMDDWSTDLTTVGSPELFYITGGDTVNTYPTSATDELEVRYWGVAPELSGGDEPLLPKRFHSLIVDGAVARAYENSDDYELAQASKARFDERLEAMRESLLLLQHTAPDDYVVITDPAAL